MAARQNPKKRRRRRKRQRNCQRESRTKLCNLFIDNHSKSCFHVHSYATRSKSLLAVSSAKLESLSSQSSDSSIICLGSFHKIPQLVTLDDSSDEQSDNTGKHSKTGKTIKNEEVSQKSIDKYHF